MDDPYVNGLIEVFSAWQDYASGQALLDAVTEGKPYAENTLARLREGFVTRKEHTEKLDQAADRITALQAEAARWKAMAEELAGSLIVALETAGDFTQVDQEACAAARQSLSRFNEMKGKTDD